MGSYKLDDRKPKDRDITHVKRLLISLKATGNDPVTNLEFSIFGYEPDVDGGDNPGHPVASLREAESVISGFINDRSTGSRGMGEETPLDFSIQEKCFVVLKLIGDFWAFQQSDAVTMKRYDDTDNYYNPQSRKATGNAHYVGVSFCCVEPRKEGSASGGSNYRHGINLKIRFRQEVAMKDKKRKRMLYLPVIIDPDIENKGKN